MTPEAETLVRSLLAMKGFVNSSILQLDFCIQPKVFWSSKNFSFPYLPIPLTTSINAGGAIRKTSPLASDLSHLLVRSASFPTPTQTFVSGIYNVISTPSDSQQYPSRAFCFAEQARYRRGRCPSERASGSRYRFQTIFYGPRQKSC